jgi:CheY-like chemotaxis protein
MTIEDTGQGMSEETCARIFEPFFTTKGVGKGTGLGLATVYGIVQQHSGMIHVYSEPDAGTVFRIYLPIVEAQVKPSTPIETTHVAGGTETILVAEDELAVLGLVVAILRAAGYRVLTAVNGIEALRVFEEGADSIALVILDVMMPGMSGRKVMDRINEKYKGVQFLFSSGYSENAIHTDFVIHEGLRLIQKPYSRQILLREVRQILDSRPNGGLS